jgi:hypothetical protein
MTFSKLNLTKKQINLIILFTITVLLAMLFPFLSNKETQQNIPEKKTLIQIKQADFKNITPGETKLDKVEQELGQPISTVIGTTGTIYQFDSGNEYLPYEVKVDSEDTVQFIERPLVEIPKDNQIKKLTSELKETPTMLYSQASLSGVNLYVFPKSGLAVEATQESGLGLSIKYFTPSDLDTIIENYFPNHSKTFDTEKYHD